MHLQNVRRILHAAIFSLSIYPFVRPSVRPSVQGAVAIKMPDFLAGARVSRCREEGMTSVFRPVHCNIMGNEICNA